MPLNNLNMAPPSMGVDYDSLAQISRPVIPGQNLRASFGGLARQNYDFEDQTRKGFLEKAGGMADMDAMLKGQAADEWMAGAEGRQTEMLRQTEEAKSGLEDARSGEGVKTKIAERVAKLAKAERSVIESKAHIWADLAKSTPEQITRKLDIYGEDVSYKGKDLRKLKPEQLIEFAQGVMLGLKETPKYQMEMDKADKRNEGWVAREEEKNKGDKDIALIKARVAQAVAQLKSATAAQIAELKANPKSLDGFIIEIIKQSQAAGKSLTEALEIANPILKEIKERKAAGGVDIKGLFDKGKEPPKPAATAPKKEEKKASNKVTINGTVYDVIKEGDKEYVMDNGQKRLIKR